MSLDFQEIEHCKVNVKWSPEREAVLAAKEQSTQEIFKESKKIALKGFRQGKAPLDAVKMLCKKQIEEQTKQKLLATALDEYVFETKAKTVFYPEIKESVLKDNQFSCEMVVLQRPTFSLGEYKGFSIPKPVLQDVPKVTEATLQDLRMQYGQLLPFTEDQFVNTTDKITVDVICYEQPNLSAEGILYQVGSAERPYLDDNLLGMKVGESRTFEDTVDGEKCKFQATVHMGLKVVPLPLDDTLATAVGEDSLDALRTKIQGMTERKNAEEEQKAIEQQIYQRLLANHTFELPQFLIDLEMNSICQQANTKLTEVVEPTLTQLRNKAIDSVKLSLIMEQIREEDIEAQFSDAEVLSMLKQRFQAQGLSAEQVEGYVGNLQNSGKLLGALAAMKEKSTLDFLVKSCTIVE